tara:strand:- start:736 stop:1164 length:429 start_codon:yes stop_codon:yes gene_type:complete
MKRQEFVDDYVQKNINNPIPNEKYHRIWACILLGFFAAYFLQFFFIQNITDKAGLTDYDAVAYAKIEREKYERGGSVYGDLPSNFDTSNAPSTHGLVNAITLIMLIIPSVFFILRFDKKNNLIRKMKYSIDAAKEWRLIEKK